MPPPNRPPTSGPFHKFHFFFPKTSFVLWRGGLGGRSLQRGLWGVRRTFGGPWVGSGRKWVRGTGGAIRTLTLFFFYYGIHSLMFGGYPPTAIGYPPTAIGYPPTAIGYPPTAIGYPPTAIGYPPAAIVGRIGQSESFFFFHYGTPCRERGWACRGVARASRRPAPPAPLSQPTTLRSDDDDLATASSFLETVAGRFRLPAVHPPTVAIETLTRMTVAAAFYNIAADHFAATGTTHPIARSDPFSPPLALRLPLAEVGDDGRCCGGFAGRRPLLWQSVLFALFCWFI